MDYLGKRNDYGQQALTEAELVADPIRQFSLWLAEAEQVGIFEPNAFVLGTVNVDGTPTARTVLLRGVDDAGFYFYTNYSSRKGHAIAENERVSMVFGWYPQFRQVLIEGHVERVAESESDAYFNTRPRDSQISAWASNQSQPIGSREALEAQYEDRREQFATGDIPRPGFWGGYRIIPTRIEFWKGRSNRLHDRIEYSRVEPSQEWTVRRLQP
jgi:pyridoxamine 5'-phosphate oxidase